MRAILSFLLITASIVHAQPQAPPAVAPPAVAPPAVAPPAVAPPAVAPAAEARAAALDDLLSERDSEKAFTAAIAEARRQGIKEQAILEARFLYHVDKNEDDALAAMLPELLKQKEHFRVADSEIFSDEEDWLAVIEYVQAIASLQKGDKAAFKQHITEAFWLSPRQGSAFATHIERMRMDDAMRSIKLDLATQLEPLQASGSAVSLSDLIKDKKALLIHFWSPTNQECTDSLPDFFITAKKLGDAGIAVLSTITDPEEKTITAARNILQPLASPYPGTWAMDRKENPINRILKIQTLPAMVIISPAGTVLFNGSPSDEDFWKALNKINPAIVRPDGPPSTDQ